MSTQEDMIFSNGRPIRLSSPQHVVITQTSRNQFFGLGQVLPLQPLQHINVVQMPIVFIEMNDRVVSPPSSILEFHQRRMEESQNDKTKPYIMLIDQPIKKIEVIDLDGVDDSMDLELKL